jgi:hypothetical protein
MEHSERLNRLAADVIRTRRIWLGAAAARAKNVPLMDNIQNYGLKAGDD